MWITGRELGEDEQVLRRRRMDLAERVAVPAEHLEGALLAILAGRADPREAVDVDREPAECRRARQRLLRLDRARRWVDHDEVQPADRFLEVLADPQGEVYARRVELRPEVGNLAGHERADLADRPDRRYERSVG